MIMLVSILARDLKFDSCAAVVEAEKRHACIWHSLHMCVAMLTVIESHLHASQPDLFAICTAVAVLDRCSKPCATRFAKGLWIDLDTQPCPLLECYELLNTLLLRSKCCHVRIHASLLCTHTLGDLRIVIYMAECGRTYLSTAASY